MFKLLFFRFQKAVLFLLVLIPCLQCQSLSKGKKRPNIIVMFTDELEFNDIGAYGGNFPTPELDKLASEGVRFNRAYCPASMCTPARFAFLTGLYPGRCQASTFLNTNPKNEPYNIAWNTWVTDNLPTIPRALKQAGYMTGMAGKWHVGQIGEMERLPIFNSDDDIKDPEVQVKLRKQQKIYEDKVKKDAGFNEARSVLWGNFDGHPVHALRFHNFPWISKGAIQFLEAHAGKKYPFFLYLTPTAIHGPNHVQDLEQDKQYTLEGKQEDVLQFQMDEKRLKLELDSVGSPKKHRHAGIANIDYQLGLIRQKLQELGEAENTIIFFMADHNIEPGKATCYEKGTNIPMMAYLPEMTNPPAATDALISTVDVFPTLMELAGIDVKDYPQLDGVSFLPLLRDEVSSSRKYVYAEAGYTRSVSDGKYKYIALRYPLSLIEAMSSEELEFAPSYVKTWPQAHSAIAMHCFPYYFSQNQLYDLEIDPYEQQNLYGQLPEKEKELLAVLEKHLATFEHPFDLSDQPYLESAHFKSLCQKNLAWKLSNIPWLSRDHVSINWPPEK